MNVSLAAYRLSKSAPNSGYVEIWAEMVGKSKFAFPGPEPGDTFVHTEVGVARRLIFAPHIDDEVLGCFAFLNSEAHVVFAGVEDRPSVEVRLAELAASADHLGFSHSALDNPVNSFQTAALIGPFTEAINSIEPHTVLIPDNSYNQDHRAVFEAALVATRPHDQNWRVPDVLVYEQPHSVVWPVGSSDTPNVFREIDIDAKLKAYSLYSSQVRGHRSPETVRALAALRGAHIGVPFAEAFHARRIVLGNK